MTVMPSGSEVADKAVSTEDASEMVLLDSMLAALVEDKVEAIKRASLNSTKGKWGSAPISPRLLRLTSSSTASSSQNHHHHHNHQHHHKNFKKDRDFRKKHRQRRYDSAPCEEFIDELQEYGHHKRHRGSKGRRRASELPRSNTKRKRRYSRSLHVLQDEIRVGLDSPIELFDLDGDLTLINFNKTREDLNDTGEYPRLHQSAYFSQSAAHLKFHYDDEDYVALNLEDEMDLDSLQSWREHPRDSPQERYHRPRRKHRRKRRRVEDLMSGVPEVMLVDHDELPPRARWTIIATACILFAMSLLLVGVTLRMAPIIDDMGDGRRASVVGKKAPGKKRSSTGGQHREDSIRSTKLESQQAQIGKKLLNKPVEEDEQTRRHRRIATIVIGTFAFLLAASVLVVVVTLTHSSFHAPQIGNRELAKHRGQMIRYISLENNTLRKENEELINSLNRDMSVPENRTVTPT